MERLDVSNIKAVFFDLDGTLSDYVGGAEHALDVVWEGVGAKLAPHDRETFLDCYWRVFEEVEDLARRGELSTVEAGGRAPRFARVLAELGVEPEGDLLDEMAELYTKGRLEGARLFAGAAETLEALGSRYTVGVITEGTGRNQRAQIEKLGIGRLLDHIVISHEVGLHKPDPALHRYALAAAGVSEGEAAMVGDRIDWDLVPAAEAGMLTVLFAEKNMYLRLLDEVGFRPDCTVRDHFELRETLLPEGA